MIKLFHREKEKVAIIRTDGGISSQIGFCILGFYLQDLGYKVKYDLSWFEEDGLDLNKKFVRNYDIPKAFPGLNFEIATPEEIKYYKKLNKFANKVPTKNKSGYLCGYAPERAKIIEYGHYFKDNFNPVDIDSCNDILEEFKKNQNCAVYVRRGDLSVYDPIYGNPTPTEYYIKAINIIHGLYPKVKFFFFSEECNWINKEIIPHISHEINYMICDKNGADKGYLDLYLMTKVNHLIASTGSLAKVAKLLSNSDGYIILDKYDENIVEHCKNVIILNDTILINRKVK